MCTTDTVTACWLCYSLWGPQAREIWTIMQHGWYTQRCSCTTRLKQDGPHLLLNLKTPPWLQRTSIPMDLQKGEVHWHLFTELPFLKKSLPNPWFTELPPLVSLKNLFFHWRTLRRIPFPKIGSLLSLCKRIADANRKSPPGDTTLPTLIGMDVRILLLEYVSKLRYVENYVRCRFQNYVFLWRRAILLTVEINGTNAQLHHIKHVSTCALGISLQLRHLKITS